MPDKCCVPECRSNGRGEQYTTVFQFPSETRRPDLRQKWIKSIPRKHWVPTKYSAVCIKHFQKEEIISEDKFTDSTGVERVIQRRCPVLKPDAYPTVFPCLPSYLSTEPVRQCKDPNKQVAEDQKRLYHPEMASDITSAGTAALHLVSSTPIVPSDALGYLESSAKTMSASKRGSGKRPTPKSFPESLLDEDDLEHLRKPFSFGWKREVVHRNTPPVQSKISSMCDIYYVSPSGKKLRSMVQLAAYVDSQKNSPVNLTHFTFKRMPIFQPPHEVVRTAGRAKKKLSDVAISSNGADSLTNPEICNSDQRQPKKIIDVSEESFHVTSSANQLAASPKDSPATNQDTVENVTISSETLSIPDVQHSQPVTFIRRRGRPRGSKVLSLRLSNVSILQRQGLMRARRRSPDWSPDTVRSPKAPLKKRKVEVIKKRNVEVITKSLGTPHSSDDEDSDLQDILGTPSKLIASIVRPEPPKRPLYGEVAGQTTKKVRIMSNRTTPSFLTLCSTATLVDRSCQQPKVVITNPHIISSISSNWRICSRACPEMRGFDPAHKCVQCGILYHKVCSQLETSSANKGLCINCGSRKTGTAVRLLPMSSSHQFKPQQMAPPAITHQTLGSLADPIVLSPCIVTVPSTSSDISKPLITSSSQLLPQLISPVFLIPGQNAATIPPPPPLASCPRFETPMTLLPVHFTSGVSPPRLQLCSIPQISQPPPLLLAGSVVPPCSQTNSFIPQLSTLQPCPPLLVSQPVTFPPSLTNASHLKIVTRIDKTSTDPPTRNVSTPSSKVSKPGQLAGTTLQTSVVAVGSGPSVSVTDTIVVSDDESTKVSEGDVLPSVPPTGSRKSGCLNTVKDLLRRRIRGLPSANDDIDDYPPVIFDPVITKNATQMQSGSEDDGMLQASHSVNFHKEMESNFQNNTKSTPLLPPDQHFSSGTSHVVVDIPKGPSVNSTQASLAPTQSADFLIRVHPDLLAVSSEIETGSSCHLHTLPHSADARQDCIWTQALTISNAENAPPPGVYNMPITSQSQLQFNVFQNDSLASSEKTQAVSTHSLAEPKPTEQPKLTRKNFLTSFRLLQTNFNIMMKIFEHLPLPDLLRARRVCKVWHQLGMQPCLWKTLYLDCTKIRNWEKAAWFFNKVCVSSLNLKCFGFPSSENISSASVWDNIKRTIPTLTHLEELFFDQVPASVLDTVTEKMPHLVNVGAQSIIDSNCFTSATPMLPMAKTVERMSQAIEAVSYGRLTTTNAAKLFQVSEKDLIHLTQTTDKLTGDEETAVLLCCLRLSSMGFSVQKDTVMSKCQEMISRRYSTDSPVPMSDSYCKDLYYRNMPLFTPEVEIKRSDTLRERFDVHYSALRRFYNSLWPKTALSADQVLAFDLKPFPFSLDKDQRFNALSSVAVTVLSIMSGCTRFLPVMAVWPKFVAASHPDLINVLSKRGMPTFLHVFQYFQKILNLIKHRPLVILCNGNASLLSEKLISSCVADSVYLYCVPPDIAQFVFPGFHGGMLHMLKAQLSDKDFTCEDIASKLLNLLKLKKSIISHSTKLAFTAAGAFPLNARAPVQYQALDLNDLSNLTCSWRKLCDLPGQQSNQSSSESGELMIATKPDSALVTSGARKCLENGAGDMTDKCDKQVEGATNILARSDQTIPTTQSVTRSRKKERKKSNYSQLFAKKVLKQAKTGQNSSHTIPLKSKKTSMSSFSSADSDLNNVATGCDVVSDQQQSTPVHQVSDFNSTSSYPHFEISPVRSEVPQVEKNQGLVDNRPETEATQSHVSTDFLVLHDQRHSQSRVENASEAVINKSSNDAECGAFTNLDNKEQISAGSRTDAHQTISLSAGSIGEVKSNDGATGSSLLMDSNEPNAVLSKSCLYSEENRNKEEIYLAERMETDVLTTGGRNVNDDSESQDSLKLNVASMSGRNNDTEDANKRNGKAIRKGSGDPKEGMDVAEDLEANSSSPTKENNKQQKGKGKKLQTECKHLETSCVGASAEKALTSENDSGSKDNADVAAEFDTELEAKRKELIHYSLIDHDYIKIVGAGGIGREDSLVSETVLESLESCEVPGKQLTEEIAPEPKMSTACVFAAEDITNITADEEATEMLACSQQYDSTLNSGTSSRDSSSSDQKTTQSPGKNISKVENETESGCCSSSASSHASDDGHEDSNSSDDGAESGSNSHTSDMDDDDDVEDDDVDDDSKCQMCMRSVPPHSKDEIINWIDCDGNCGRWFHVICITRSQSKADSLHFVCPSCRCTR